MKKIILAIHLACIPAAVFADDASTILPARLSIGYDYLSAKPLTHPLLGTFQDNVTFQGSTFNTSLIFPQISASDRTSFVNGLSYRHYDLEFNHWDGSQMALPPEELHSLQYLFLMTRFLTDAQYLSVFLLPGIDSDFQNIEWNHARLDGGLIANFKSDRSLWGLGLVYTTIFGKPRLLPALSWRWHDGEKLFININLPSRAEMWYALNESWQAGLLLGFSGNQFRIGQSGAYQDDWVRYSSGRFGPGLRWKLPYGFDVRVEGGLAFARRYGIYDGNNETQTLDSANGGFIKGEISYRWGAGRDNENDFVGAGFLP